MEKLFSYGTLQQIEVQQANFGRTLIGHKATIAGYKLASVEIKDTSVIAKSGQKFHPILTYTGNKSDLVQGMCFELTHQELKQADSYEVADYTRVSTVTTDEQTCWVYAAVKEVKSQ